MVDAVTGQPLFQGSAAAQAAEVQTAEDKAKLSSDFETFLKMLTAQVQNQDPLNPVDSTDYATQLATFSTVEQAVLTNDLLRGMSSSMDNSSLREVSGWIGMEALVDGPTNFDGAPLAVRIAQTLGADRVDLSVKNADGEVVATYDIAPGEEEVLWTGVDDDGNTLPEGQYSLIVESYDGDNLISTNPASVFNRIDEVRSQSGATLLRLANGVEISPDGITALREARQ